MGNHGATPPLSPPLPLTDPQTTGAPAPLPPRQVGRSPLPLAGPRRPGGGGQQGPPPRTQPPAPAGTAMDKQTRASTQGRHTDRARGQQASTNRSGMGATPSMARATPKKTAFWPAQEGQRDGPRQGDPQPHWPPLAAPSWGTARRPLSPPTPAPGAGTPQTRRPTPRGAHSPKPGMGGNGTGPPPPPSRPNGAQDRGRTRGGARTGWNGPASAQHRDRARCARHTDQKRGGGHGSRNSASAHTHKGHTGRTRRATRPSPRNAQTAWNGVPASEDKEHPDGKACHTQRGNRGAGRGNRGRHNTRHQPQPPEPGASAAHTRPGHCTRQGSSGAPRHAPAPRLGSLRVSPRESHWRQASSTGPAAPAPRATMH